MYRCDYTKGRNYFLGAYFLLNSLRKNKKRLSKFWVYIQAEEISAPRRQKFQSLHVKDNKEKESKESKSPPLRWGWQLLPLQPTTQPLTLPIMRRAILGLHQVEL